MSEIIRRIRPTPTDRYLGNPHKGCCTFQRFNGDPLFPGKTWSEEGPVEFPPVAQPVAEGYLPSTVAYCRWFWRLMEPEKGRYDFSMIDRSLEVCRERGQTLAVRLMAYGSGRQPGVPDWYARQYPMAPANPHGQSEYMAPVHDAPEYLEHWGGFMREFARRYDGRPLIESIDVAFIGPWGEGAGVCCTEQCEHFVALWKEAFTNTPRLALMEGKQLRLGIASGSGWRCDCFGDLHQSSAPGIPPHLSWNHTYDCYPRQIFKAGGGAAWKTAPVHLETCWVPALWYDENFDIDFILEQGLKVHATYFMPKSTRLPAPWMDKLAAFCRRLGYRFVYRQAQIDTVARPGEAFHLESWIENTGVAPIYREYAFAIRMRQRDREEVVTLPGIDIRTWLPGDIWIDEMAPVPAVFREGDLEIAMGLIDRSTLKPRVRFAIEEQDEAGWAPLGTIRLK